MKQVEHGLQVGVARLLQLCLDPDKTWFSGIDHAAKLDVKINKKTGARYSPQGQSRKNRGIKKGLPDFIVMCAACPLLGIELKSAKGRLSDDQIAVQDNWRAVGHSFHVARSLEEVQEILEFCRVPMRRRMFTGAS